MLILSRRPGESITIGDDVVITVVSVNGNQIRLGITAPRDVRVLREEIYKAIREENQAAASTDEKRRKMDDAFKRLRQGTRESAGE